MPIVRNLSARLLIALSLAVAAGYHALTEATPRADAADARPQVQLVELSEINRDANAADPWISEDGLTIYWSAGGNIWTAHRADAQSLFREMRVLFKGRHPTVSANGLQMILLGPRSDGRPGESLHVTSRISPEGDFQRPQEITELRAETRPKGPCLSPDGLTLYYVRGRPDGVGSELAYSERKTPHYPWATPRPLPFDAGKLPGGFLTWPQVTGDGLKLLCANEGANRADGNLMLWTRPSREAPFASSRYVQYPGIAPLVGRSPRYVAATSELFFVRMTAPDNQRIWVIKGFNPADLK